MPKKKPVRKRSLGNAKLGPVIDAANVPEQAASNVIAQAKQMEQEEHQRTQERIGQLLSGRASAPNEHVAYIVDRMRAAKMRYDAAKERAGQLHVELEKAKEMATKLSGEMDGLLVDLQHWDKEKKDG